MWRRLSEEGGKSDGAGEVGAKVTVTGAWDAYLTTDDERFNVSTRTDGFRDYDLLLTDATRTLIAPRRDCGTPWAILRWSRLSGGSGRADISWIEILQICLRAVLAFLVCRGPCSSRTLQLDQHSLSGGLAAIAESAMQPGR